LKFTSPNRTEEKIGACGGPTLPNSPFSTVSPEIEFSAFPFRRHYFKSKSAILAVK
jgi:hypothetical protein